MTWAIAGAILTVAFIFSFIWGLLVIDGIIKGDFDD